VSLYYTISVSIYYFGGSILFVFLPPPPSVILVGLELLKEEEEEDTPAVGVDSEVHTLRYELLTRPPAESV